MARTLKGKLSLAGREPDDARPDATLVATGPDGEVIYRTQIGDKGDFELPDSALEKADRIYIGPVPEDAEVVDTEGLSVYRTAHVRALLEETGRIEIPRAKWAPWLHVTLCTSGTVRHCFPYPWVIRDLSELVLGASRASRRSLSGSSQSGSSLSGTVSLADTTVASALPAGIEIFWPYRCRPVCEGIVEVYRRVCCCDPWIVYDPRLEDLLDRLERVPIPPFPLPDPPPLEELDLVKDGALDPFVLNAKRDLAALRELTPQEKADYLNARPYLYCWQKCGPSKKIAKGYIQPDGTFAFCWQEPLTFVLFGCHFEYAYVVKQVIDGQTVTIYDGRAANQWFDDLQGNSLVSYHKGALHCDDSNLPDHGNRFAVLERIGDTDSYRLDTPLPNGPQSVTGPIGPNHGLGFTVPGDAKGTYNNRNWGGTLPLYFKFSESLKSVARRYRVSVAPAPAGVATEAPTPLLDPVTWRKYHIPSPGTYTTVPVNLGPDGNGTFEIPYGHDWVGGRYHAYLDTTRLPQGRYLVILELFDNAGNPVTPADGFDFLRWTSLDNLTPVATAALPHLFWWDNRRSHAKIESVDGGRNTGNATCMFIEGPGATPIRVEYEASHPEERFQHSHALHWWRGIGSGVASWPLPAPYDNVPGPSNPTGRSSPLQIQHLLDGEEACSFGIRLRTHVKTFNGSGILNGLEDQDQAAFALKET